MQTRSVLVGKADYDQLLKLVSKADSETANLLFDELDSATIVTDRELLKDIVVMGSTVTFRDIDTKETSTVTLVYPDLADPSRSRISILAPIGAALIGLRIGEEISWPMPGGKHRHLEIIAARTSKETIHEH